MVYVMVALRFYMNVQVDKKFVSPYCGSSILSFQLQEMYKTWNLYKSTQISCCVPFLRMYLFNTGSLFVAVDGSVRGSRGETGGLETPQTS